MKHVKLVVTLSVVTMIGILSVYTASIWPTRADERISVVPTDKIDSNQGIGGVATQSSSQSGTKKRDAPNVSHPDSHKVVAFDEIAPKQAAIKQATPVEYEYRALAVSNDPLQQPSWVLNSTRSQAAWDMSTGNGAVVAVIDSGFALEHEDLKNQWYQNSNETGMTANGDVCWTGQPEDKSSNSCDDDSNGYEDDWRGWDFVGVNNSPQAGESNPTGQGVAHGTEVSGLVGATGNNSIGTATVSWNNKIMPLQALSDDGSGYTSSIAAAVYYAVDNGASVINMSLGGDSDDPTLAKAIKYAYDNGVVAVAAAGNCGTGNEAGCDPARPGAMGYPALNPYVIAVGASTSTGARASFSSYGPGLDVSAPGSGTLVSPMWQSTNQTSAYATSLYGTSFASPIVASYIGLLKSIRPATTVDDITALVNATAWKPSGMNGEVYTETQGHGIIDASVGLSVSGGLNAATSVPELAQTGDNTSEHSFKTGSTLSSGCKTTAAAYCTIWAKNARGYDRYLPYVKTSASGQAGWTWSGSWLGTGDWSLKARSGASVSSTPYQLFNK